MTSAALRSGQEVDIRAIEPSDAAALVAFHEGLRPESRRLRFFSLHPHLTAEEVEFFTTVNHSAREALVAVLAGEIIGVGRYDQVGPDRAEVAFVVADEWHKQGIATTLLKGLAAHAAAVGIKSFHADTLCENRSMLDVFRHWSPTYKSSFDGYVIHVEMELPPAPSLRSEVVEGARLVS